MNCKEEKNSENMLIEPITNPTLKSRIKQVLDWHIERAACSKRLFYIFSIVLLILNASIPIFNKIKLPNIEPTSITTIIASVTTVVSGILVLMNSKDMWYANRETAEEIKTECIKFACNCYGYNSKNLQINERKLANNIEGILAKERQTWIDNKDEKDRQSNSADHGGNTPG